MHLPHLLVAWDRHLFLLINHTCPNRFLDWAMPLITDLGLGHVQALAILTAAIGAALWHGEVRPPYRTSLPQAIKRRSWWVVPLLTAIIASGVASDVVKNTTSRSRPWWFYEQEHRAGHDLQVHIRTVPGVYPLKVRGFPSGHTATSVAVALGITLLMRGRRRYRLAAAAAWVLAGLIAFSRLYLASHWPLDVAGGAALGAVCGWASVRWWTRRLQESP
ncbi:MAG: phosphatase PAP2 family protein [Chthonomonadales bacterium]